MKSRIERLLAAFFAIALSSACAPDDETDPAPVESIGGSMTAATGETGDPSDSDPTANDSAATVDDTGDLACEDMSVFECRGWRAAVYKRNGEGDGVFYGLPDGMGGTAPTYECVENMNIVGPMIQPDDPILFALCMEECESTLDEWVWPAVIDIPAPGTGQWELAYKECVFDTNGNNGYLFTENSGVAECDWMDTTPGNGTDVIQQVLYVGMAEPEDCAAVSCTGWNPNSTITYSYNSTTKTHTTAISSAQMSSIWSGQWEQLYGCDTARWKQNIHNTTGVETWSMQGLVAGDFLYRMGFRNGDHTVKIQRNITGTPPIYTLWGPASFSTIFEALIPYHSFKLTFRRPKTASPGYDVHTMLLTL